ncbi:hypothetical protein KIN20_030973 [Parelaphostrongylus tenuis]|uniref:Uncharacterized protein n=1 Tax=Parelaphostrongylus tenuis TaxID=148309 RepID=A0AAD5R4V9_PARTN|nr:hypothetical protein KIN20_030973 [Parelaphostrongylus tenuis]
MQVGHDLEETIPRHKMRRYGDSRKIHTIAPVIVVPWQSYNGHYEAQAQENLHFFNQCVFSSFLLLLTIYIGLVNSQLQNVLHKQSMKFHWSLTLEQCQFLNHHDSDQKVPSWGETTIHDQSVAVLALDGVFSSSPSECCLHLITLTRKLLSKLPTTILNIDITIAR